MTRDQDGVTAADIAVVALCLIIVAFWTVRALGGENGDMNLAWLAGDLTWNTGRPEVLFSWTGTPLLATGILWFLRRSVRREVRSGASQDASVR